jgi:hypothetical protein
MLEVTVVVSFVLLVVPDVDSFVVVNDGVVVLSDGFVVCFGVVETTVVVAIEVDVDPGVVTPGVDVLGCKHNSIERLDTVTFPGEVVDIVMVISLVGVFLVNVFLVCVGTEGSVMFSFSSISSTLMVTDVDPVVLIDVDITVYVSLNLIIIVASLSTWKTAGLESSELNRLSRSS